MGNIDYVILLLLDPCSTSQAAQLRHVFPRIANVFLKVALPLRIILVSYRILSYNRTRLCHYLCFLAMQSRVQMRTAIDWPALVSKTSTSAGLLHGKTESLLRTNLM